MKKPFLFAIISFFFCLFIHINAYTQKDSTKMDIYSKSPDIKTRKWYTGGGLGLQLGDATMIEFSPLIGYRFTKNIAAGMGFTYQYFRSKDYLTGLVFKTNVYGGSIFARYCFLENFIIHSEFERLSLESLYFDPFNIYTTERFWEENLLVGGSYRSAIGERSYMYIMLLYNLNDNINNHYGSPIVFKTGIEIGL